MDLTSGWKLVIPDGKPRSRDEDVEIVKSEIRVTSDTFKLNIELRLSPLPYLDPGPYSYRSSWPVP